MLKLNMKETLQITSNHLELLRAIALTTGQNKTVVCNNRCYWIPISKDSSRDRLCIGVNKSYKEPCTTSSIGHDCRQHANTVLIRSY